MTGRDRRRPRKPAGRVMQDGKRHLWQAGLLALGLLGVLGVCWQPPLLIHNPSSSLPPGLYVRDLTRRPWQVGDLVVLETPDALKAALPAGYEGKPLLKQIAALSGMLVCWEAEGMAVYQATGTAWYGSHPAHGQDRQAVRCQVLGAAEMVITGSHTRSYDSRYIGPVSTGLLRFRVWPLWTREASS